MLKSDSRGLRRRETSRRKVYRCSVGSRGNEDGAHLAFARRLSKQPIFMSFLQPLTRGRYEREIQALPGTTEAVSSRDFFKKSRTRSSVGNIGIFRGREPRNTWRANDRVRERLLPHGGPTWFFISVCARRPTEPDQVRLSNYIFPEHRRENTPQPLWQKDVLDFRQKAPVADAFSMYFWEAVRSIIPKNSGLNGVLKFTEEKFSLSSENISPLDSYTLFEK